MSNYKDFLVATGSSGGGSSAIKPTVQYDKDFEGTWNPSEPNAWDEHSTYCRVHQYSPKGQFAVHSHTFSSSAHTPNYSTNRLRIRPFLVNQSTGAITMGTAGNAFNNTGGYAHSTQSFGFSGKFGVNWGHSPWGSNTTHYNGGCVWRVENNAVHGGSNTGNTTYASENTSNGNLAVYEDSGTTYYNIPNGGYTSLGSINSNGNANDWASQNEFDHGGSTTIVYRCIGNTVGENHAGLCANNNRIIAMNATGGNGTVGSAYSEGGGQTQSGGIGFELNSGKQIYFTNKGTFIRGTKTGGITGKATVSRAGVAASPIDGITGGGSDLALIGCTDHGFTYNTTGTPAKEDDTFYFYMGANPNRYAKFKITNPSGNNITIELLGTIDLSGFAGNTNISRYSGMVQVTGNDDQFLVCSHRSGTSQPSKTIVVDNPIKDA